jgi:hypothetical protein
MTISTSWSSAVNRFISLSTEKPASLQWRNAETFGCVTPNTCSIRLRQLTLWEHLVQRVRQPQLRLAFSGIRYPRSSNTFVDPRVIVADSPRRFAIMFLVISLRLFQPLSDQVHVSFSGPDAGRLLLLERVKQ